MQVSLTSSEGLERKVKVEIPVEEFHKEMEKRVNELSKTVNISGFRKGKVPPRLIQQKYGDSLKEEVGHKVMDATLANALNEIQLNPVARPKLEILSNQKDKPFEYVATFEVYPEFKLKTLAKVKVNKVTAEITEQDVDKMLEKLRKSRCDWKEVERASANEDKVNIDFDGTIDGEPLEGGKADNFDLQLGSNSMIAGFEEGLLGLKAGDSKTLSLKFPEEYHHKAIAGKSVNFEVKVNKVLAAELPELNDEFAKQLDIQEGGFVALRTKIQENMSRELADKLSRQQSEMIFDKLLEANPVELPKSLVRQELLRLYQHMMEQMKQQGMQSPPNFQMDVFESQASKNVHLGLIIGKYVEQNDLKVDKDSVEAKLNEIAGAYDTPNDVITLFKKDKARMAEIENRVLQDQIVANLYDEAKVTEEKLSYETIMESKSES